MYTIKHTHVHSHTWVVTQPSIKKFNLINNYMASKNTANYCWVLEFVLTINRSTMVSYQKIIKGFWKFHLVFKWELFVSFRAQMVLPFLFRMLQFSVLCQLALFLWIYVIYGLLQTDKGLKTSHIRMPYQYLCNW